MNVKVYYGGDTLASMDMILMDQECSRISATIGNKMVSQFESLLKEGGSLNLSNFYVVKNNGPYKVANHPFKINFHKKTKVKAIQSVFPSKHGFSFVPFTDFVEDNVKEDQVVDVIGHIAVVGDVIHRERKGKKNRRMVVELADIDGLKLKCTIWDAFIDDFKTKMKSSSYHLKVCVFQFGSVRKYKESVGVSNTFYSSRFFINDTIPGIDDFRSRLLEQPCVCATLETITSIGYEEGWVYTACCECNCKAIPNDDESSSKKAGKRKIRNTYKCETCSPDIIDVIPKFRVQEEEANKPNAADYPDDLNKLIGKTLLFRVGVSRYNLINNYVVYTVGRMTSSELFIKTFIKLYIDEMDEVRDVNEYGSETDGDNEEPKLEITQNPKLETGSSSKDVESSMAENMVTVEPVEVNATPLQGKCRIADVDKDKGALSVTSRNKKKVVVLRNDK
nr:replication protein A 70 kDa DNA-binding subunit B [Tanacetum cinerariifolium]